MQTLPYYLPMGAGVTCLFMLQFEQYTNITDSFTRYEGM